VAGLWWLYWQIFGLLFGGDWRIDLLEVGGLVVELSSENKEFITV
jgi:hypothetical protein